jgi:hypothetical protein
MAHRARKREDDHRHDRAGAMLRHVQKLKGPRPRKAKEATVTERRVRMIMALMADGPWVPGQSERLLADSWDLSADSVRHLTNEASQRLAGAWLAADKADLRARCMQAIARLADRLEGIGTESALTSARQCRADLMRYAGLEPATKLEHTTRLTGDAVTPAAAAAIVRATFGDHARRVLEDDDGEKITRPS